MTTSFGPRLIGETEKTLNAILRQILDGTGLDEQQWVTLNLADLLDVADGAGLSRAVRDRAHFESADRIVAALTDRGLLDGGHPSPSGGELLACIRATVAERTAPIWEGLPYADVEAATRVLREVAARARQVVSAGR